MYHFSKLVTVQNIFFTSNSWACLYQLNLENSEIMSQHFYNSYVTCLHLSFWLLLSTFSHSTIILNSDLSYVRFLSKASTFPSVLKCISRYLLQIKIVWTKYIFTSISCVSFLNLYIRQRTVTNVSKTKKI